MKHIDIDNQTDIDINSLELLEEILLSLSDGFVELILVDNDTIASINKEFRGKDTPTDVLSFPLVYDDTQRLLGSIVISVDMAKQKAKEFNHSIDDEIVLLFIHGLLHLLGYDHEIDNGEMREMEKELIEKYKLPKSLIVRTKES